MRALLPILCLALLSGCSTHPITGRDQMVGLSSVQVAYADVDYALSSGVQRFAASLRCAIDCGNPESPDRIAARVEAIGVQLEAAARSLSPELFERIERFSIEIDGDPGIRTGSSAGGRIVLSSGLAGQRSPISDVAVAGRSLLESGLGGRDPTDIRMAFLIAREMGHVIARHAEENSGVSIAVSVLGLLVPGVNVIARLLVSKVGVGAVQNSWAADQEREADDIALALLSHVGLSVLTVSHALGSGADLAGISDEAWGSRYLESMQRVAHIAATPLRYSGLGG